jgi:predicted metal-dependent hydrolase
MRLAVYPDGAVVVTAPSYFGIRVIEYFLAKHAGWLQRKVEEVKGKTVVRIARRDIPELKQKALRFAQERCVHYASVYGVSFSRISIRAQKTRWGSCSHTGSLTFNYRIAALPAHLAEYVIVHEMCHLLELNHSADFWRHVARIIPEHKAVRKEIRNIAVIFT